MPDLPEIIVCPVCAQKHMSTIPEDGSTVRCSRCNPVIFEHTPGSHIDFAKWLFFNLLLIFSLITAGCATLNGGRSDNHPKEKETSVDTLPFPSSRRETRLEPLVVSYPEYRDPLIWMNRGIFAFNDITYRYLLIPLSKGYTRIVPDPVQKGIGNFFYNIKMPVYAVNHLFQLKMKPMGINLLRFGINSTIGILGLFDPAKAWWGLDREETGFENTLSLYGAGYGIYVVLPFFGPSDLRNSPSIVVDNFLNPVFYLTDNPERTAIQGFDFFQGYAPGAERYETLRRKSSDPYIFFRNLYLQGVQRDARY